MTERDRKLARTGGYKGGRQAQPAHPPKPAFSPMLFRRHDWSTTMDICRRCKVAGEVLVLLPRERPEIAATCDPANADHYGSIKGLGPA